MTDPKYTPDRERIVRGLFGLEMPVEGTEVSEYQKHGEGVLGKIIVKYDLPDLILMEADLNNLFDIMEDNGVNLWMLYRQLVWDGDIKETDNRTN